VITPSPALLTSPDRIATALAGAHTCESAVLIGPGTIGGVRVRIACRGGQALEARSRAAALPEAWHEAGRPLTGRFADANGVYTFSTVALGGRGPVVLLARPLTLQRQSRRAVPRHRLPPDHGAHLTLPTEDGAGLADVRIVDLSTDGLRLALPPNVLFPLGRMVRLQLGLRADREFEIDAVALNLVGDDVTGALCYGLVFLGAPERFHRAVERFLARLGAPEQTDLSTLPHLPGSATRIECPGGLAGPPSAVARRRWEYRG
jgi:hypothetical protein